MERFSNDAQTTLNGAITNSAVSLVLTSATGFPTTAPFRLRIENEIILVGAISGATCSSLTRGAEGTTAASHATGVVVEHVLTAAALESAFTRLGPIATQTLQAEADVVGLNVKEKTGGQTAPLFRIRDASDREMLRVLPLAANADQITVLGPGDPAQNVHFHFDKGPSGRNSGIRWLKSGLTHWYMDHDSGDNYGLNRYDDAGAYVANVYAIMKATGHWHNLAGMQATNDASVFTIGEFTLVTNAKFSVRSPSAGPLYGSRFTRVGTGTNNPQVAMAIAAVSTGTQADGFGPGIWFQTGSNSAASDAVGTIASIWVVRDGSDSSGAFKFNTGSANTERMRISNNGNIGIGGISYGGGVQVVFLANATTIPNSNPTAGGILYVENGALKWRGSAGTVTQLAVA